MIQHADSEFVNVGGVMMRPKKAYPPVPHIPCMGRNCERCRKKTGGRKFRWYSRHWLGGYIELMREGSWVPPSLRVGPDPRGTGELLWEDGGELSDSSDSD